MNFNFPTDNFLKLGSFQIIMQIKGMWPALIIKFQFPDFHILLNASRYTPNNLKKKKKKKNQTYRLQTYRLTKHFVKIDYFLVGFQEIQGAFGLHYIITLPCILPYIATAGMQLPYI